MSTSIDWKGVARVKRCQVLIYAYWLGISPLSSIRAIDVVINLTAALVCLSYMR